MKTARENTSRAHDKAKAHYDKKVDSTAVTARPESASAAAI